TARQSHLFPQISWAATNVAVQVAKMTSAVACASIFWRTMVSEITVWLVPLTTAAVICEPPMSAHRIPSSIKLLTITIQTAFMAMDLGAPGCSDHIRLPLLRNQHIHNIKTICYGNIPVLL